MLTNEEREQIDKALRTAWRDEYSHASVVDGLAPAVESIVAARVRAARAQELRDWADELDKPPYDLWDRAAIPRLRDRANHIESSQTG